MSKAPAVALLSALLVGSTACAPGLDPAREGRPTVVTTTNLVADTVRRVGGDLITVDSLMGPGVDPHLYKASESDVRRLAGADLILYSGLHLEGKMGDILVKMARSRPVVALAEAIPEEARREPPELSGLYDPHVWFDVRLWRRTIEPVVRALSELAPEHAEAFRANGDAYAAELDTLDAWIRSRISSLPPERRVLVTAHDAFGYFGAAYGMEVVAIQGISTLSEAGLRDVERVVDLVVERKVPAIFVESSVPRRTIESVQAAVREQSHEVAIGGQLFSDSVGGADTPEGTYVGAVRHNVNTIVDALSGTQNGEDASPQEESP